MWHDIVRYNMKGGEWRGGCAGVLGLRRVEEACGARRRVSNLMKVRKRVSKVVSNKRRRIRKLCNAEGQKCGTEMLRI